MATVGKGARSIRRADMPTQKTAGVAFIRSVFAHKAAAGETGINLMALTSPGADMPMFTQPGLAELTAINLKAYAKSLVLWSDQRGPLVQNLHYDVTSASQIVFRGFVAQANEIFSGMVDRSVTNGLKIVASSPIVAAGTLVAGQTDINVGVPFSVNQNAPQQIGAVMVFVQGFGGPLLRNVGNSASPTGNYYEVDAGAGLGTLVRLNAADAENDRWYIVVGTAQAAERPDGSMMAYIESVQGQLNTVIDVLAEVSGQATSYFQTAPSGVDLKTFGDRFLRVERPRNVSGNVTVVAFDRLNVDTTSGAANITLPAAPQPGDTVQLRDAKKTWQTNACTVLRNGKLINGAASDMDLVDKAGVFELTYIDDAYGWSSFALAQA